MIGVTEALKSHTSSANQFLINCTSLNIRDERSKKWRVAKQDPGEKYNFGRSTLKIFLDRALRTPSHGTVHDIDPSHGCHIQEPTLDWAYILGILSVLFSIQSPKFQFHLVQCTKILSQFFLPFSRLISARAVITSTSSRERAGCFECMTLAVSNSFQANSISPSSSSPSTSPSLSSPSSSDFPSPSSSGNSSSSVIRRQHYTPDMLRII